MSFREKWIEFQLAILDAFEEETFPSGQEESPEFRSYLEAYDKSMHHHWTPSTPEKLEASARKAKVLLVGDYHTHPGSANTILWLLEALSRRDHPVLVFLEALPDGFASEIEAYTKGLISEETFLSRVGYGDAFGFDWAIYRPVIDEARRIGAPVFGINTRAHGIGLAARDSFAASVIAGRLKKEEDATALVLVGEKHLAPSHLPLALKRSLRSRAVPARVTSVHRNIASVYFDLLGKGHDGSPLVLKGRPGHFLIQDTSPLSLQSRDLYWFHSAKTSLVFPDTGQVETELVDVSGFDEPGLFYMAAERMASLLLLEKNGLDEFHIFTGSDLDFFEKFRKDRMDPESYTSLLVRASRPGCFYIPEYFLAYLKEITPTALGRTSALHIAAKSRNASPAPPFVDSALGTLGSALLDPCSMHAPLKAPSLHAHHPAIRTRSPPDVLGNNDEEESGRLCGFKLFQALVRDEISLKDAGTFFTKGSSAAPLLKEIGQ